MSTILVTGASRGIGRAIALSLAQAGYDIVVHCKNNLTLAQEVADQIMILGCHARVLQCDVSKRAQTADILLADIEAHGPYYGVVCNAGLARDNAFPAMTGDEWDSVIHTNLDAFYNVLHPLIMPMVRQRQGGRIITLASVSALMGHRGQTNYSAAKAGIIAASKALAIELATRKITVNCVAPGLIATDMLSAEMQAQALPHIPLGRVGQPEEVAALVTFLMSPQAAYITRQVISVNGGMLG
jgi:3-oxoacyl-[acyl-carrier protein] reductase